MAKPKQGIERGGQAGAHEQPGPARPPQWRRNRKLARGGFKGLEYMPRQRAGWNATLAAYAFSARRAIAGKVGLDLWAAMHGCPASARYAELGEDAVVLWHGTSDVRAERIRQVGLRRKRGVWATLEPKIAHGYTRGRAVQYGTGSATVVLVLDRREVGTGLDYDQETPEVVRFHHDLPAEWVEYVLWDGRVEFTGVRKAREPSPWGVARFKKKEGEWVPLSQPPVRLDRDRSYSDLGEWLDLSIERILTFLGSAAAIEIFSSVYSTLDPWDALRHRDVFDAIERLCGEPRRRRNLKVFSLRGGGDGRSRV